MDDFWSGGFQAFGAEASGFRRDNILKLRQILVFEPIVFLITLRLELKHSNTIMGQNWL